MKFRFEGKLDFVGSFTFFDKHLTFKAVVKLLSPSACKAFRYIRFELTHWPLGDLNVIFINVIFNIALLIRVFKSSYENVLRWMPQDLPDQMSTLVQVMAWCRQATSHYLNQCWPRSPTPYGVTRTPWVKMPKIMQIWNSHPSICFLWVLCYRSCHRCQWQELIVCSKCIIGPSGIFFV